jgi:predicted RNA-binding Zn ribbon-like protein
MASNPAPGELELVRAFINTWDADDDREDVPGPAELRDWLVEHDLLDPRARVTAIDHRHAIEVREALRALLLANNGEPYDPDAQAVLERASRRSRLEAAFPPDGAALVPRAEGVDAALGRILAAAFAAMLDGSWKRLKACPREVCGWAFYDRSTNASATWCSMRVCGGRVKAGAYYRRRRAAGH